MFMYNDITGHDSFIFIITLLSVTKVLGLAVFIAFFKFKTM